MKQTPPKPTPPGTKRTCLPCPFRAYCDTHEHTCHQLKPHQRKSDPHPQPPLEPTATKPD